MRNLKRQLLAGPYILWMAGFILLPVIMILYYAFTTTGGSFTLLNVSSIAFSVHIKALLLSLKLALMCTLICLILSYPLAMILNNMKSKSQGFIVFIFILPMWMNFLLRTMAWQVILEKGGLINNILAALHLPALEIINTPAAIVLGMVYDYLPFMVLPIYNTLMKIDDHIIEAAYDLGATKKRVLFDILLPLSVPCIASGVTMVFVPSLTTFVISNMLGGGKIHLIGNIIEQEFTTSANWNLGSGLSLIMMIFIVISMAALSKLDKDGEGNLI